MLAASSIAVTVMLRNFKGWLFGVALCVSVVGAQAQQAKPEDVIAYRQAVLKTVFWNFMSMGQMVKGSKPWDAAEFKRRSLAVSFMALQMDEGFPAGSDKGAVTDALPAIWENRADFDAKLREFQRTSNALRVAANGGDVETVKAAFGKVRNSCMACHEKYRAD